MPALLTQRMPIISMNCHRFTPPQKGEAKEHPPTQWGGTPSPPNGGSTYPPMGGTNNRIINNKIINNKTIKTKTSFAFYTGKSTNVAFPGRCFNLKGGMNYERTHFSRHYSSNGVCEKTNTRICRARSKKA